MLLNATPDHLDRHGTLRSLPGVKASGLRLSGRGRHRHRRSLRPRDRATRPAGRRERGRHLRRSTSASSRSGDVDDGPAQPRERPLRSRRGACDGDRAARPSRARSRAFPGVPHRLERVAEIGGVAYVNDSKATNVAAAVAALESFEGGVHAIMGGSLKGADFSALAAPGRGALRRRVPDGPGGGADRRRAGADRSSGPALRRPSRGASPRPRGLRHRARPCCLRRRARALTPTATTRRAATTSASSSR